MFDWVAPLMWGLCRIIGDTFTFIGLVGLAGFAGIGIKRFYDRILYEEEPYENQD